MTSSSATRETVAGTVAGLAGKMVEHPLDTVKTRLQEQCSAHRNMRECFNSILQTEGAFSFFRGVSAPLVVSAYEHAFTFLMYSEALLFVERWIAPTDSAAQSLPSSAIASSSHRAATPLTTHAIAGGLSGLITSHLLTPAEFLKCRMQQSRDSKGLKIRDILANGGWKNVFDGHSATVAREVPGTAAWFVFYELSLRSLRRWHGVEDLPASSVALAGGCAGVMYWSAFFPADVVKTRMQLDAEFCRRGLLNGLTTIAKKEGLGALYRGWSCTVISAFPGNAAIFLTYETMMEWMSGEL